MAAANYQDVGVALGRPISDPAEQDQITYWLDGIELLIAARLGDVTLLPQGALRYVETEAVADKARRRGQAESSITVAVDDGSVTRRYDTGMTATDISDDLWNLLDPTSGAGSGSIRPGFDPDLAQWPVRTPPYCGTGGEWWFR